MSHESPTIRVGSRLSELWSRSRSIHDHSVRLFERRYLSRCLTLYVIIVAAPRGFVFASTLHSPCAYRSSFVALRVTAIAACTRCLAVAASASHGLGC